MAERLNAGEESMVIGESMPVEKEPGAKIIGGTINGTGSLVARRKSAPTRSAAQARSDPKAC
jgi:cation transport ATPase